MRTEPSLSIRPVQATDTAVAALIERHLAHSAAFTPPESIYAMGADGLADPAISMVGAWDGAVLLGIGALRDLGAISPGEAEIKSMHTAEEARGRGVGATILACLMAEARSRGFERVSLETGYGEGFAAARKMYERAGFAPCGPFGDHSGDPNSAYYTLAL
ncbi:MAG: GNAT family N-acetyltransferase [Pseudomonadota bacterium]